MEQGNKNELEFCVFLTKVSAVITASIEDEYHILFQCSKYFEENTLFFKVRHTLHVHAGKLDNNEKQKVIFSSNDPAVNLYVATLY